MMDKNTNTNEERDNEFGDKEDFRLSEAQSYINIINLTYI